MVSDSEDNDINRLQPLINEDGARFEFDAITAFTSSAEQLDTASRTELRNDTSNAVADHSAVRMLVAAGPGTGKSYIFMNRIRSWIQRFPGAAIYVTSFVNKLVADLDRDVRTTSALDDEARSLVTVSTLHGIARSVLERNGGHSALQFDRHIQIIAPFWQEIVWNDTVAIGSDIEDAPTRSELERQYHNGELQDDGPWADIHESYTTIRLFYNAVGFADSIYDATLALGENSLLVRQGLWIFDEFQDFNRCEERFIATCVDGARGVLLAGDDDQALYQQLKLSHPEIIREYYNDSDVVNAMLPFCGRCSYHICMVATRFLAAHRPDGSIPKVYLPLEAASEEALPVRLVAATTPQAAVGYIADFIDTHRVELETRRERILANQETEPFLLILSPEKNPKRFLRSEAGRALINSVHVWTLDEVKPGEDYQRIRAYYELNRNPADNFTFRKVMYHEQIPEEEVHVLLRAAIAEGVSLNTVNDTTIARLLALCAELTGHLTDLTLDADAAAANLAELVDVGDMGQLAVDLETFPMGTARVSDTGDVAGSATASPIEFTTMVGAKGLSADHVVMIGVDNINMKRVSPELFFVALTRARESLHLITALGARGADEPHRFAIDLPEEHCKYLKRTVSGVSEFSSKREYLRYFKRIKTARSFSKRKRR